MPIETQMFGVHPDLHTEIPTRKQKLQQLHIKLNGQFSFTVLRTAL